MRNKLVAIWMFVSLVWLAIRHANEIDAEINGPELDATR